ncbi:poly(hydroxyalkanoate) depolymerase family esterase [Crossiella equi]|uniref:Poly(Hydroxyalkanoate) depolymerase family esterase n=1 Tax=Crossiella equi TaxID=130796 RepID=A0ABS5A564_9PSEU|nr:PHB depolymerase family esterase [Crossiella equi]MBP2471733.1 poly(hydroxyalkanoate) depolymerase family esterase [Crossiella equi]
MRRHAIKAVLAALLLSSSPATAVAQPGTPRDERSSVTTEAGWVEYEVHVPPQHQPGRRLPLVVALHGCTMTGYTFNSMKELTRLNRLADERGFLVVYPNQNPLRNLLGCWNAADPKHQRRGTGEAGILGGMTAKVAQDYGTDPRRTHVVGASAGAGMAVVLQVAYPDVFASAASVAGGEYAFHESQRLSPVDTARLAYAQMGSRARVAPLLVGQGSADETVPPAVADRLVTHWAAVGDLATDGLLDGDVDDVADASEQVAEPGERPYLHTTYRDRGGKAVVEKYVVDGLAHKWPGGPASHTLADPLGPDLSRIVWEFFAANPR